MNPKLLMIVLVCITIGSTSLATGHNDQQVAYTPSEAPAKATVRLEVADTPQAAAATSVWLLRFGNRGGSAVAIHSVVLGGAETRYSTLWLAAAHCVNSEARYGMLSGMRSPDTIVPFHVVLRRPGVDMAILETLTPFKVDVVSLRETPAVFGERVYLAGWSRVKHLFLRVGYQASTAGVCSCTSIPGDSGGAILDADGKLLGIVIQRESIQWPGQTEFLAGWTIYIPVDQVRVCITAMMSWSVGVGD